MKEKYINAVLVDVDEGTFRPIRVRNNINAFYEALKCDLIDIVCRDFHGSKLDIICDDEGLLDEEKKKKPAIVGLYEGKPVEIIVGNVLLTNHDEDGETTSLTEKDYANLAKCLARFANGQTGFACEI